MSDRQHYLGEQLSHAVLQRRQREVAERHRRAMGQVSELLDNQKQIGRELSSGLTTLKRQRSELDRMEQQETDSSLLASLVRPFTARRSALARRSIAEGLLRQYEQVSVRLREATAFSDELKLCALELQQEVDRLHRELGEALHNQRVAAERVLQLEEALVEVDEDASLRPEEQARRRDRFEFDARTEAVSLELYKAAAELCRQHIPPARALRDTVLQLHEEMAQYVLSATHTVNAAGRRIQGLGMLADAPIVVQELQESLDELNLAMEATADYVERSSHLIAEVLPHLSARVQAESEATEAALEMELAAIDRERSRVHAERTLREAAQDEIESLLGKDP
ncbi:MAG TPA: hypothetical protein ENK18_16550 [Deltaproteobacteria bacterium]|nr:hypothetical protein [Deltaproteobacteria bacterium]